MLSPFWASCAVVLGLEFEMVDTSTAVKIFQAGGEVAPPIYKTLVSIRQTTSSTKHIDNISLLI
jgi:hypothetical protein